MYTPQHLHDEITQLHAVDPKPDVQTRIAVVHALIERYYDATGALPPCSALGRMADYLLVDDLADVGKRHRGHEYPFHSGLQTKRRHHSEVTYDPNVGRF